MPHGSDHDILNILDLAGPQWSGRRAWEVVPLTSSEEGSITLNGPSFLYRWDETDGPVQVSFWPNSQGKFLNGTAHHLAIEPGLGTIRLHAPGQPPLVIGAVDPLIYQQIGDLTSEAHTAQQNLGDGQWPGNLNLVAAAMRLATLTREAARNAINPGKGTKRTPRKEQVVTQLHEWLRANLEITVKLEDAAKQFGRTPRQFIRLLKETTGAGYAEHLAMHRLTYARALLMRTGHSVIEIARRSGFNSREQFIRTFNRAFRWTPLQFRKAWSQATLKNESDLQELCQVEDRSPVEWLDLGEIRISPEESEHEIPHTVVVANAMHEIVELFWVTPQGKRVRIDVLERGGMVFVNRDCSGSSWIVRCSSTGQERCFVTPDDHAIAIVRFDQFCE